jgi:hypothetical protein
VWSPKTPSNYVQLQKQASSIKALLRIRSRSPPSPSDRALNQLIKGCELAIQNAIFLAKENTELRAKNEKKKRKRTRSTRQIPSEEGLSVLEASTLIAQPEQAVSAPIPREAGPAPAPSQPRTRALPKCSICGIQGHKLTTCPNRTGF